ncbi:hypothetical protein COU15_01655 [Candidatus Kaiserbacteria bacterium CG10_big_fil_rev_8_21_14_0_10_45_20]|uniref:Uncharacterized protein n=1 Tax=Candidatus Kaiserbacteria bacterium CG10_big_fil_rev_8_21_14_0_10_45_20 TaxID=1974607 RepID=A0A2H0UFR2_9BACT|nr:MAG: hypothetical protein COU15_01655 [Candidatus Kaiserbacteria bacterium CG10_big_fil_rev_8_21_14_0_10_45_20]
MKINLQFQTSALLRGVATPHPKRDWYVLLGGAVALGLLLIATALYLYVGLQSGVIFSASLEEDDSVPVVSREALQDIVSRFETVEVNYETGNIRTADVGDPR